jgi:hypothetical protein
MHLRPYALKAPLVDFFFGTSRFLFFRTCSHSILLEGAAVHLRVCCLTSGKSVRYLGSCFVIFGLIVRAATSALSDACVYEALSS